MFTRGVLISIAIGAGAFFLWVRSMPEETQQADPGSSITSPLKQDHPQRAPDSYEEALEMAGETGKPMFLFFHASWCHSCVQMEQTLGAFEVDEVMHKNYHMYAADADVEEELLTQYDVELLPTFMLVDKAERVIKSHVGYMNEAEFLEWLSE